MTLKNLNELLYELTADVDAVDIKMKKVIFPVDEDNFADENFRRLYSCSKQYNVLSKVCNNILNKIENANIQEKHDYIQQFAILESCIPCFDYDDLEICPESENLKLKYIRYLKQDKINLNSKSL